MTHFVAVFAKSNSFFLITSNNSHNISKLIFSFAEFSIAAVGNAIINCIKLYHNINFDTATKNQKRTTLIQKEYHSLFNNKKQEI